MDIDKPILFYLRDMLQIVVGASILAVPVAFTQEVWDLGSNLPLLNVIGISLLSLLFIVAFVYYNYHHDHPTAKLHYNEFIKRVLVTYIFSMIIVAIILTLIQVAPWQTEWVLALKRVLIVSFPASMSAAVADALK